MSVTEIIEAVQKLSPSERAKVADAMRDAGLSVSEIDLRRRQRELHLHLLAEGRLKSLPDLTLRRREFKPVKIKGKPLSETIIEERR